MSDIKINQIDSLYGKIEAPDRHPVRVILGAEGEVSIIQRHGFEEKCETVVFDIPTIEAILKLASMLVQGECTGE